MSDARILDRGFQRYTGERRGPAASMRAMTWHTIRRILGLKRRFRHKLIPLVVAAIAYLPAAVFLGIAAIAPAQLADQVIPGPTDFLAGINGALLLFTAFSAPDALCADRRSRTLGIYLASPLTRVTYLLAKGAAVVAVLLVVTLGPSLLIHIGRALLGVGPAGFGDVLLAIARAIVAGLVLAVGFTAVGMAAASLTDRRAFASAGILLGLVLLGIVSEVVVFEIDGPQWIGTFDVGELFLEVTARLYGESLELGRLGTAGVVAAAVAWVAGLVGVVAWRYRKLEVTR